MEESEGQFGSGVVHGIQHSGNIVATRAVGHGRADASVPLGPTEGGPTADGCDSEDALGKIDSLQSPTRGSLVVDEYTGAVAGVRFVCHSSNTAAGPVDGGEDELIAICVLVGLVEHFPHDGIVFLDLGEEDFAGGFFAVLFVAKIGAGGWWVVGWGWGGS